MRAVAVVPRSPIAFTWPSWPSRRSTRCPAAGACWSRSCASGVDGTDKEINAAAYGTAPDGHHFLVIGHEGFGRVEAVGDNVTEVRPGDYVVATVRRPGTSLYDVIGTNDMTTDDTYFERGINPRHGYLTEYYVDDAEFIVKIPRGLREVGVLLEPLTVVDRRFLERVFQKLLLNWNWWINRKDLEGKNVFQGGFLGLDNIGVFDRSAPLPTGGHIEQSDGTAWMGAFCLNMLAMALELARDNQAYEDMASKFFEHFMLIADAMGHMGGEGERIDLWHEEDGFLYDVLHTADGVQPMIKLN